MKELPVDLIYEENGKLVSFDEIHRFLKILISLPCLIIEEQRLGPTNKTRHTNPHPSPAVAS
jgi:hypothetical protein